MKHITRTCPSRYGYFAVDNLFSELTTEMQKQVARDNLGIADQYALHWGNITGHLEDQIDLYNKFNEKVDKGKRAVSQIEYTNDAYPNIKTLQDALNQLLYKDLTISFQCSPDVKESGEIVNVIKYTWSYNKPNIVKQLFNGNNFNTDTRTTTLTGTFTTDTTATLKAFDGTNWKESTTSLKFYPGLYYGISATLPDNLKSSEIISFSRKLQSSRNTTITVNCTTDKHIYICIPYSYGPAVFKVGGFEGGFELVNDNYSFTRYNTVIRYRIYRSDYGSLGNTTITIS